MDERVPPWLQSLPSYPAHVSHCILVLCILASNKGSIPEKSASIGPANWLARIRQETQPDNECNAMLRRREDLIDRWFSRHGGHLLCRESLATLAPATSSRRRRDKKKATDSPASPPKPTPYPYHPTDHSGYTN
jgi:hypothetical protein